MDDHILCESPLVRVTTAHGSMAPCEHLPLYVFRGDMVPPSSRDSRSTPPRYAPIPTRAERDR